MNRQQVHYNALQILSRLRPSQLHHLPPAKKELLIRKLLYNQLFELMKKDEEDAVSKFLGIFDTISYELYQ